MDAQLCSFERKTDTVDLTGPHPAPVRNLTIGNDDE